MKVKARNLRLLAATFGALFLMETAFRGFTLGYAKDNYFVLEACIITLISLAGAALMFFLRTAFRQRTGKIIYNALMAVTMVIFAAQIVYYYIFETFFTFYSMLNGAQVVEFQEVIWDAIFHEIIPIIVMFALGGTAIFFSTHCDDEKISSGVNKERTSKVVLLIISAVIFFSSAAGTFAICFVDDENPSSPHQNLWSIGEIQGSVKCSGLMGAMTIDLYRLIFGFEPQLPDTETVAEVSADDNVIGTLDFGAMAEGEKDKTVKAMHEYFGSVEPTEKNSKTGIFKGKNLIFITAESFTDFAVDPVYTPTLYKLQTEGYTFTNFYNPIWGVSTLDGEYVNLQGLVPKPGVWSMKESSKNSLPFTLGNQLRKEGYQTKAYHNHSIYYYDRNISHPNLGYDFSGQDGGYHFKNTWPESDLEMIDKTTSDFLTADEDGEIQPFHVYYLTVSGHMNYNFYGNDMASKNEEAVKDLDMSEPCRAYMACNIELDRALGLLLARLEEAGELDNTVIAIAGDHYPYGLSEENISEFRGHEIDTEYEMYESTFILWSMGMEPEKVDKVCSNMDILPTLSNMFGLEYDSRLLMGRDIFSDSEGFVVFKDKDWISERGTRGDLIESDREYASLMDEKVRNMFNYSALTLDKDYYFKLGFAKE